MAISTQKYQGTLTNLAVAVLSAGANDVLQISKALITNTSATTAYTYTIHDDAAGSGAATGNICQNAETLSPKETRVLPLSALAALAGGKIWMLASTTGVLNVSITYTRTSQ